MEENNTGYLVAYPLYDPSGSVWIIFRFSQVILKLPEILDSLINDAATVQNTIVA